MSRYIFARVSMMATTLVAMTFLNGVQLFAVVPQMSAIAPAGGPIGSTITITGSGFSTVPSANSVVFFSPGTSYGSAVGQVLAATSGSLTVAVPAGAATGNVYVMVGSVVSNGMPFTVVTGVNRAPTVSAGLGQTIALPAVAVLFGTVSDDGFPSNTLSTLWTQVSGPGSVNFGTPSSASTGVAFPIAGVYVLRLTANDGQLSASSDVMIVVNPAAAANQPPSVNPGAGYTVYFPNAANLAGTVTDDGKPFGTLSTAWTQVSGPGAVSFGNSTAVNTSASFSLPGTYVLRLTATDAQLIGSADVTVTVNNPGSSGNGPSVDAGPAKVIALPAKDVTLFGHATDPDTDMLTVQWTQTGGPAPVSFSAPQSLTTTVSFSTAGMYAFSLTVSDGTTTVTGSTTVIVKPAASQTAFYVDPTYTGSGSDGSAARPWKTLSGSPSSAPWIAINQALASNNVIVYFSARQAGADTAELLQTSIDIWRTDTSPNRLTLDGMSKYNANDAAPAWADYTGTNRFQINVAIGSLSIGVQNSNPGYPMNYTTIRGFDVSGASGRVLIAGNYSVLEYTHVHNISSPGANIQLQPPMKDYPSCVATFGNLHDITMRGNSVDHGYGEGIYLSGTYFKNGCLNWGNTHSDILVEANSIDQSVSNGGETDNIDMKAGLMNVTVRGNDLFGGVAKTRGIVATGVFPAADGTPVARTNYVIENNRIHDRDGVGLDLTNQNYATVRNNIFYNVPTAVVVEGTAGLTWPYTYSNHVRVFNNTLVVGYTAIAVYDAHDTSIKNNLITGNGGTLQMTKSYSAPASNIDSDYNVVIQGGTFSSGWVEGVHSLYLPQGTSFFVDPSTENVRLNSTSPAIDRGMDLRNTGFASDYEGIARPVNAWDIGASQFR